MTKAQSVREDKKNIKYIRKVKNEEMSFKKTQTKEKVPEEQFQIGFFPSCWCFAFFF